jgi:hypothetical protein
MATHDSFNIAPFWDDEYKNLNYFKEKFNDPATMINWEDQGFRGPFGGWMCDMRNSQPTWNNEFITFFESLGWKNIGTSYYKMDPGSMLPLHVDTYAKYINLFDLHNKKDLIRRAIVFLEPWQSGHYAECDGHPYTNWIAGFTLIWHWDTPHMAINMGTTHRYTLQVTGHL